MKLHRLNRSKIALMAAGVSLAVASSTALSSGTARDSTPPQGSGADARSGSAKDMKPYRGLRASQVIGMSVRNSKGVNVGQIRDMIVDMSTGKVRYAMLAFDPGIFQGEKLFAVPTSELRMASDRDDMVYDMNRERLERAAVDRSAWDSRWRSPDYLGSLDRAWGIRQPSEGMRAHRVSDLLGKDVNARSGEDIGEIEELVIDMANQRVHYAVLEFDPSWASPEQNYAFPLRAFNLTRDKDELVLDVDKATVQSMKSFTDDRYANLNDRVWVADVDRYLVLVAPTSGSSARAGATSRSSDAVNAAGTSAAAGTTETRDASTGATGAEIRAARVDRN